MRITLITFLLLCALDGFNQNNWNTSFKIKSDYKLGESQNYTVKEFYKVDNIFIGFRSTVESIVNFEVVDTSNGGYWIRYTVIAISAKSKKDQKRSP